MTESQVEVPQTVRDTMPDDAQKVYAAAYAKSWNEFDARDQTGTSRQAIAARDAWAAVYREYVKDDATHQWHRKGETPVPAVAQRKQSPFSFLFSIFGRK